MENNNEIVEEALQWVGTTWRPGQSKKGISCDCVGLVIGVGRALGLDIEVDNYSQVPRGNKLVKEFERYCYEVNPLDKMQPGDILLFSLSPGGHPCHVGFFSGKQHFIHADSTVKKVVEVPLGHWTNLIVKVFRLPTN